MASSFSLARSASLGGARKRDPFGNHIDDVERALGDPGASSSGGEGGGAWTSDSGHVNGSGSYQDPYGGHLAGHGGQPTAYTGYGGRPGPPASSSSSGRQGPPGSPGLPSFGGAHQHQRSVGELYPSSMTAEGLMRTGMLPTSHGPPPQSNRSSFHGAPPPSPSSYAAAKLQVQQSPHMTSNPFPTSPQLASHQQMPPPQQAQRQQMQPISALKYGTGPGGPPPPPPSQHQQQQTNPYIPASPSQHAPPPPSTSLPMGYSYSGGSGPGASPSFGGRAQPPSSSWTDYSPRSTPQIEMRSSPVPPQQQQQHYQAAYTPPSSTASPNHQVPYGLPANAGSNPYAPQNAGHAPPPPQPPQANAYSQQQQQQQGPPPPQMLQQRSASSSSIHFHGQHRTSDATFQQFSAHPPPGALEVAAQYGHHPGARDSHMAPPPAPEVPQQGFRRISSAEEVRGRTPRHAAIVGL